MKYSTTPPAVLLLEDGTVFHGKSVGVIGTTAGEICFNTGMTGYQEIFTDPSYEGQIMVMAAAHIGNYGVYDQEAESDSLKIAGLVCKNFSRISSRYGKVGSLQDHLVKAQKVGISDVDTRAVVRHIRDKGAMNAIISSEVLDIEKLKEQLSEIPDMKGLELSSKVTTSEPYEVGNDDAPHRVALLDLGVKKNIIRCLNERDCKVKVFPMTTTLEEIRQFDPHGVLLSNGPGDPAAMESTIAFIKELIDSELPVFGICLGHQLMALSQGLATEKMHAGHRGINHPVKNLQTLKDEITSQNHGFVVKTEEAEQRDDIDVTHLHLNDGSIAGLRYKGKQAFSVQYHPEGAPGPFDPRYLFDDFVDLMKRSKKETAGEVS